jgi:RNA polymerase sigma-70 factor (ECF subfamily)
MSRLTDWVGQAVGGVLGTGTGSAGSAAASRSEDWALWRRARDGHAASATALVRLLTPQAYGLALRLLGRPEDAEDAVQDAFLRLWRSAPSDRHGAKLSTYFNTIVINRCRSAAALRRETATDPQALTELHDARTAPQDQAGATTPHAQRIAGFASGAAGERLQAAIALLPLRQRMAISMWAYADAEAHDIAKVLEVNVNAAHQLLHRAREALRAQFDQGAP